MKKFQSDLALQILFRVFGVLITFAAIYFALILWVLVRFSAAMLIHEIEFYLLFIIPFAVAFVAFVGGIGLALFERWCLYFLGPALVVYVILVVGPVTHTYNIGGLSPSVLLKLAQRSDFLQLYLFLLMFALVFYKRKLLKG